METRQITVFLPEKLHERLMILKSRRLIKSMNVLAVKSIERCVDEIEASSWRNNVSNHIRFNK